MQELTSYDPEHLVAGILGGAAGTTRDTFELALQAEQSGAKVALFGRKINLAEAPLKLVELMRSTIEKKLSPVEAVKGVWAKVCRVAYLLSMASFALPFVVLRSCNGEDVGEYTGFGLIADGIRSMLIVFLMGKSAGYLTGQGIVADGGWVKGTF